MSEDNLSKGSGKNNEEHLTKKKVVILPLRKWKVYISMWPGTKLLWNHLIIQSMERRINENIQVVVFWGLFCVCVCFFCPLYIFVIFTPYEINDLQIFPLILWVAFSPYWLIASFDAQKFKILMKSNLSIVCLLLLMFLVSHQEIIVKSVVMKLLPYILSNNFI